MAKTCVIFAVVLGSVGSASCLQAGRPSRVGAARVGVRPFAPRLLHAVSPEVGEDGLTDKQRDNKRLRDAEVFMVKDTGRWECRTCSYVYDPAIGDGLLGKVGMQFEELPQNWSCPQCQSPKPYFISQMTTIAGFAENQSYGLGGNSMTEGQKSNLIFGGIFAGFLLLMSGYLLT
ncbi:hypothetical protein T492DRAFT_1141387 [Pavlovales sp. CCMP2436]|nr:hypothetical protein T492DRAFT_1141387 [Pavlovales sp. CCMP2436]